MRHDAYRRLPAATAAASVDRSIRREQKIKSEVGKKKDKTRQDKSSWTAAAGVAPNRNKKILTLHPHRFHVGMPQVS
jgi:hypothetical protein